MWRDKNIVGWCNNCNVPILDAKRCGTCNRQSIKLNLRFKGEVRPLFPVEKEKIRRIISEYFSDNLFSELSEDSLWFFNETSRTEFKGDVIMDGKVLFEVHYDALKRRWRIKPYKDLLRYVNPQKRVIYIYDFLSPSLNERKGVYASWIKEVASPAYLDEYVIVDAGDVKGIGKVVSNPLTEEKNRRVVKIIDSVFIDEKDRLKGTHLKEVIEANSYILEEKERETIKKIENAFKKLNLPLIASFSGGKDSSAVVNICLEYDPSIPIVFLDTGIEFPETLRYVDRFAKELRVEDNLIKIKSPSDFFELWKIFGPPSRSLRWCCKTQKFAPMNKFITANYPTGVLSVLAVRKHESLFRSRSSLIERNRWIHKQVSLYPIKDWGLLDVWLYIFWKRLPYNELYELGIPRVGCWPCPFQSQCIFNIMETTHPHLIQTLYIHLLKWATKHGFSKKWVTSGEWRLRNNNRVTREEIGHAEPCIEGKPMVHLVVPTNFGKRILRLLPILTNRFEGHFIDGKYVICIPIETSRKKLKILLEKSINCQRCGLCIEICPHRALRLGEEGIYVDGSRCQRCYVCLEEGCIASNYSSKRVIAIR